MLRGGSQKDTEQWGCTVMHECPSVYLGMGTASVQKTKQAQDAQSGNSCVGGQKVHSTRILTVYYKSASLRMPLQDKTEIYIYTADQTKNSRALLLASLRRPWRRRVQTLSRPWRCAAPMQRTWQTRCGPAQQNVRGGR